MELEQLKRDCTIRQKKGLHFIAASILIWFLIVLIHLTDLNILQKNMLTLCCSAILFPVAILLSKWMKIDFQGKGNPLTNLCIIFSVNQILYILIAMWVFAEVPNKMLMVYTMIFGAHLMPYGWLYKSRTYYVFSIIIPILALIVGLYCPILTLAVFMLCIEIIFTLCLYFENRKSVVHDKKE